MLKHRVSVVATVLAFFAVSHLPLQAAVPVGVRSSTKTGQPATEQRRAELARAIEDLRMRVTDLVDEGMSIADEVASLGNLPEEELERLMRRKHAMDLLVGELERDLDSTSAEFRRPKGARPLCCQFKTPEHGVAAPARLHRLSTAAPRIPPRLALSRDKKRPQATVPFAPSPRR